MPKYNLGTRDRRRAQGRLGGLPQPSQAWQIIKRSQVQLGNERDRKSFPVPRSLRGSAIGYEIMELPYNFESIDTGYLKVGFRIDDIEDSVMDYVDDKINKYIKENLYIE
ncbi:MAG: hypothetical protein AB1424_07485 [Thermodesulfobacteriota bacterium]